VGRYFQWAFNLVNSKDDPESIDFGGNPKEALVVGSGINLNLDNGRVQFKSSFQASMKNENAEGEVDFDTIATRYDLSDSERDKYKKYVDMMEDLGFLTLSQGLAPIPSLAMQFEGQLQYFNQSFRVIYKKIESEFTTPGNPYLQKDIQGMFITDNIRMLNNRIFMNLYFNSYDNFLDEDSTKIENSEMGGSISYFPRRNWPSVTLSYSNNSKLNDFGRENKPSDSLFAKDNSTQRIGLSSSYNFNFSDLTNTLTFNISQFTRDDVIRAANQSEFFILNIGLRNRFSFPLTIRTNYSTSNSGTGEGDLKNTSDFQKYFLGLDYLIKKALLNSDLKPYLNFSFQKNSDKDNGLKTDSDRINFTTGLYLRNNKYGNFSLRYDYIDYGKIYGTTGSIFSTRYEVNL